MDIGWRGTMRHRIIFDYWEVMVRPSVYWNKINGSKFTKADRKGLQGFILNICYLSFLETKNKEGKV